MRFLALVALLSATSIGPAGAQPADAFRVLVFTRTMAFRLDSIPDAIGAWYTAGGNTRESYHDPLFVSHLLGGIMYAAGA